MRRARRSNRLAIIATAGAIGLTASGVAQAGPITGSGMPIATEQSSLGLTYLVRTEATNLADLGQVVLFAGNYAPGGFSIANGQLLPLSQNTVLFSQLGTTYGGNGFSNFALPNLSGRTVVGTGQGAGLTNRNLGSVAGAATETLTASELPPNGGASHVNTGSQPVPTLQPSLALNQGVVVQGAFPVSSGPQATSPLIGQVLTFAGSLPTGERAADGATLPINQNAPLYSVIGNTYGGSFPITFALPNLAGRAVTGAGAAPGLSPQALGQTAGAENTTLTVGNLPPQPLRLANGTTAVLGGGMPLPLQQPSLALQYIIAVNGVFPTEGSQVPDETPFLGEITPFAGTVAPAGWAFANGQVLSIAGNQALFAVIGDSFGGNGISTFALPDLEDRLAVGTGDGVTLGELFGADSETLNFAELPLGYPAAVRPTSGVPEPPAIAILLVALAGLGCARRCARRSSVGTLRSGDMRTAT
ncbi:MAG TPA: tail fiber protein [Acetobacteraceae bacterium]|nr:tail fiber protein [Acetobacteraceae bacterium]